MFKTLLTVSAVLLFLAAPARADDVECLPLDKVGAQMTPPDLYKTMGACIEKEDYETAGKIYGVAIVGLFFDSERVADPHANRRSYKLLTDAMVPVDRAKAKEFRKVVFPRMKMDDWQLDMCVAMRKRGAPSYAVPTYLLSSPDADPAKEMVPMENVTGTWERIIRREFSCRPAVPGL